MHNICNKISTILQYRKENRVSGTQINVQLSVAQNKYPIKLNYTLHGYPLESLEEIKCLTIRLDLFEMEKPCKNVCTKAIKTLGFLRRNLIISSTFVKQQAYKNKVRSSFEYACSAWNPYKKSLKIPKGQSESVYRRRTNNTMAKRKKGQITINKTYI